MKFDVVKLLPCITTVSAFAPNHRTFAAANTHHLHKMTATAVVAPSSNIKFEESSSSYATLLEKLRTITHLNNASSVLSYDRQVFMPSTNRSSAARGKQMAVLATISHEKSIDPEIGKLIEQSQVDLDNLLSTCDGKTNDDLVTAERILELEKEAYNKRTCIPSELAARKAELEASAYSAWVKARENNDFASFAPSLKDCFDLAKEIADLQRGEKKDISLYSQMLDEFEIGMPASRIDELFGEVQSALVPFIAKIRASENKPSLEPLKGKFDIDAQKKASLDIVTALGYDESHGRLDVSVHPFTMSLSGSDVRITSRFDEEEWYQGLAGSVHEAGHAIYEQNTQDSDLSIDSYLSMGVHESQSLFWERHIGKSPQFFEWAMPLLKERLGLDYTPEQLYAAVNAVDFENYIRVEADELTYPLHVILRKNIEQKVVTGELGVDDVPSAWNTAMHDLLGVDVPDMSKGCLQDIHWSMGAIGYFPTYLLGAMMSAQLYHHCKNDLDVDRLVTKGEFSPIRKWLTEKIHKHGKRYKSLDDLLVNEFGEPLRSKYFVDYLMEKYTALYKID